VQFTLVASQLSGQPDSTGTCTVVEILLEILAAHCEHQWRRMIKRAKVGSVLLFL
jgi:hypothetical protein